MCFISGIEESFPCQKAGWQKKKVAFQKKGDSIQDSEREEPVFPFSGFRNLDFSTDKNFVPKFSASFQLA